MRKRIAVFVSGKGSNLENLFECISKGEINGEIVLVLSSNKSAYALEIAKNRGVIALSLEDRFSDSYKYSDSILEIVDNFQIDLIVLAGFLKILSGKIIERFKNRIINLHPSLIPAFCGKGFYGERVHRAVIEAGVKITGASVHFVDSGTDTGPIILQAAVPVLEQDDVETLSRRVALLERSLLPEAVRLFCQDGLVVNERGVSLVQGGKNEDSLTQCFK